MFNKAVTKYQENKIKKLEQEIEVLKADNNGLNIENESLQKMVTELNAQLDTYKTNFDALAKQLNDSIDSANNIKSQYETTLYTLEQLKEDYKKKVENLISGLVKK